MLLAAPAGSVLSSARALVSPRHRLLASRHAPGQRQPSAAAAVVLEALRAGAMHVDDAHQVGMGARGMGAHSPPHPHPTTHTNPPPAWPRSRSCATTAAASPATAPATTAGTGRATSSSATTGSAATSAQTAVTAGPGGCTGRGGHPHWPGRSSGRAPRPGPARRWPAERAACPPSAARRPCVSCRPGLAGLLQAWPGGAAVAGALMRCRPLQGRAAAGAGAAGGARRAGRAGQADRDAAAAALPLHRP
jgi:hypothetical protein